MLVTDFDAPTGGVQKNSRLLLSEFNDRGIKTYACVRNYYDRARNETVNGTEIYRTAVVGSSMTLNGILYMVGTFLWLMRNRNKFDVMHCQQAFGPTMVAVVAGCFIRKPILTRITLSGPTGEAAAIRQLPFAWIRLRLIRRVDRWVVLTKEMKREIVALGIPAKRITVIHNAAEMPVECRFEAETRQKYQTELRLNGTKLAVFTGRLSQEKCIDVLIRAWKDVILSFPGAQLLILGEGGDYRNVETELKELVETLGLLQNVAFLGHVNNTKDYLLASDAFVLPSNAEGMSNSLVEAFACGCCIIATDIPSNREICGDNLNSLLFTAGDTLGLSDLLRTVFENPERASILGKAARAFAEERLTLERMVDQYLECYSAIMGNKTDKAATA